MILSTHRGFRSLAVELTTCEDLMRAGSTDRVRLLDDDDRAIGMLNEIVVDGGQIGDKRRAVPFATESLQAQEGVATKHDGEFVGFHGLRLLKTVLSDKRILVAA
jgi:hypothetical protein